MNFELAGMWKEAILVCFKVPYQPLYGYSEENIDILDYSPKWPTMKISTYCHVYYWLKTGCGLVIGFVNHLQVVTTNNYYTIAYVHNLQSLHTNILSLFPLVFTVRFLATDL
jgi:hypothetical protein